MDARLRAGRRCFSFIPLIRAYKSGMTFDSLTFTVVACFPMNGMGNNEMMYQLKDGNDSQHSVPVEHVIPVRGLAKTDRIRITRLCKLIGYLRDRHPNGSELISITGEDILNFKHGKGKIAAFLKGHEKGLGGQARAYVDGRIRSLNGVNFERKHRRASDNVHPEARELKTWEDAQKLAAETLETARKFIYGQDDALRLLIVRFISYLKTGESEPLLLAGPTGVGKTHSVMTLADIMEVPFGRIAIPDITPAGYVGANFENTLAEEIRRLKKTYNHPRRAIIQIDEFDKVVRKGPEFEAMLQDQVLKVLEPGNELVVGTRFDNGVERINMPVMVVLSGAFSFIKYDHLSGLGEEKLREAGFTAELTGRMGNPIILRPFDEEDFRHLLTADPPLKVLTRSTADLAGFGIEVVFDPETIEMLAKAAAKSKMGARKLASDVRNVMDGFKNELLFGMEVSNKPGITVQELAEGRRVFRIGRQFAEQHVKRAAPARRIGFG